MVITGAQDGTVPILAGATAGMRGEILDVHPVHNNPTIVRGIATGDLGTHDDTMILHERRCLHFGSHA